MIEDTRQPIDQPMQANEKAFNIVWCGETHDNIDFSDVSEKAKEVLAGEVFELLVAFTEHKQEPRKAFYELLEDVAVKMLEGDL